MVVGSKVDFEKFKNAIFLDMTQQKQNGTTLGVDYIHPAYQWLTLGYSTFTKFGKYEKSRKNKSEAALNPDPSSNGYFSKNRPV